MSRDDLTDPVVREVYELKGMVNHRSESRRPRSHAEQLTNVLKGTFAERVAAEEIIAAQQELIVRLAEALAGAMIAFNPTTYEDDPAGTRALWNDQLLPALRAAEEAGIEVPHIEAMASGEEAGNA